MCQDMFKKRVTFLAFSPLTCMLALGHFTAGKVLQDSRVKCTVKSAFIGVYGLLMN